MHDAYWTNFESSFLCPIGIVHSNRSAMLRFQISWVSYVQYRQSQITNHANLVHSEHLWNVIKIMMTERLVVALQTELPIFYFQRLFNSTSLHVAVSTRPWSMLVGGWWPCLFHFQNWIHANPGNFPKLFSFLFLGGSSCSCSMFPLPTVWNSFIKEIRNRSMALFDFKCPMPIGQRNEYSKLVR